MIELGGTLPPEMGRSLVECGTIALTAGASTLSILLNKQVTISPPEVSALSLAEVSATLRDPSVAVEVPSRFGGGFTMVFVLTQGDTAIITDLMMGGEGQPPSAVIDDLQLSAISEAINQMMGMAANALSTSFGKKFEISPPQAQVVDQPEDLVLPEAYEEGTVVILTYRLVIEGLVESSLIQILPESGAEILAANAAVTMASEQQAEKKVMPAAPAPAPDQAQTAQPIPQPQMAPPAPMPAPVAAQAAAPLSQRTAPPQPAAQTAQFAPLSPGAAPAAQSGLDLILDVPLRVTVELGRTRMQIRDVLELGKGSVVELDKLAGEPVDLLVNGKLIARGEVVVIDESFGVRVTDIVSPAERFSSFRA